MLTMHPAEPMAKTSDKVIFFLRVSARFHTIGIGSARISRSLTELHTALAISGSGSVSVLHGWGWFDKQKAGRLMHFPLAKISLSPD